MKQSPACLTSLLRGSAVGLVLALIAGFAIYRVRFAPVQVISHRVLTGPIVAEVGGTGTLNTHFKASASPELVQGRLVQVLVDQNDFVTNGQLLAVLDAREQRCQVEAAHATLSAALATVHRVQADAEVYVEAGEASNVLVLPAKFLFWRDGQPRVLVNDQGWAWWHNVKLGLRGGDAVEVTSGLTAGEQVVAPAPGQATRTLASRPCPRTERGHWLCRECSDEPGVGPSPGEGPQVEVKTFNQEADGTLRQWAEVDFLPGEAGEKKNSQPLRYVGLRLLKPQGVLLGFT